MSEIQANTTDLFQLNGKVAIVTGASGLLGEQHAIALSDHGAHVILADLYPEKCTKLASAIEKKGRVKALALECDVTKRRSWESLAQIVVSHFGKIDVLVNNAAFTNQSRSANYAAPFQKFPLDDWNKILEVNLTGSFLGCQIVGEIMLNQGAGSIINIASLYGVVSPNHRMYPETGISQPVAYSVSKAGVVALTRYVATLWGAVGVRVNCITPGGVYNDHPDLFTNRYNQLSPAGRMAKKEEMRGALVYLASEASSYCQGHNLVVDGGWTAW